MRHRLRPRRLLPRVIAVAVACTVVTPIGAGSMAEAASPIRGSGSTFAEVALDAWSADLYGQYGLSVDYDGNGSLGGLRNFQDGIVDFAATDVAYGPGEDGQRSYQYAPIVAGGAALAYNVVDQAGNRITNLRLTPPTIADIFFGTIRSWTDEAILRENPQLRGVIRNGQEIRLGVRTAGSGTTGVFTDFLSTTAPSEWQDFVARSGAETRDGGNLTVDWPSNNAQFNCFCSRFAGSNDIANWIAQASPGSVGTIGYVEASYAAVFDLSVVRVRNAAGYYRGPDARSVAVALLGATQNPDGTQNLDAVHTSTRPEAYPISSYTYLVIPVGPDFDPEKGGTLSEFLIYSVTAAQDSAAGLGYSPLPPNLVQFALDRNEAINGHIPTPPLGDWGRAWEALEPDVPIPPDDPPGAPGLLVAEYADSTFTRGGSTLRVAPGELDDRGRRREELELSLTQTTCSARSLITTEIAATLAATDLGDIVVDARAGTAHVGGTWTLTGTRRVVPAGRGCRTPDGAAAVSSDIALPVTVIATWRNRAGSVPDVYTGGECGDGALCYSRAARAGVTWLVDGVARSATSTTGFLFEGTYPVGGPS